MKEEFAFRYQHLITLNFVPVFYRKLDDFFESDEAEEGVKAKGVVYACCRVWGRNQKNLRIIHIQMFLKILSC